MTYVDSALLFFGFMWLLDMAWSMAVDSDRLELKRRVQHLEDRIR